MTSFFYSTGISEKVLFLLFRKVFDSTNYNFIIVCKKFSMQFRFQFEEAIKGYLLLGLVNVGDVGRVQGHTQQLQLLHLIRCAHVDCLEARRHLLRVFCCSFISSLNHCNSVVWYCLLIVFLATDNYDHILTIPKYCCHHLAITLPIDAICLIV